jgi:hypothetical protein
MARKDGGPAFPRPASEADRDCTVHRQVGMSLRDWFAGQALAGIIAAHANPAALSLPVRGASVSEDAYAFADAMLRVRERL